MKTERQQLSSIIAVVFLLEGKVDFKASFRIFSGRAWKGQLNSIRIADVRDKLRVYLTI